MQALLTLPLLLVHRLRFVIVVVVIVVVVVVIVVVARRTET
jgi:hypothetical protein